MQHKNSIERYGHNIGYFEYRFLNIVKRMLGNDGSGKILAIWGLSFRPQIAGPRTVLNDELLGELQKMSVQCRLLIPASIEATKKVHGIEEDIIAHEYYPNIEVHKYHETTIENADGLLIGNDEIPDPLPSQEKIKSLMKSPFIHDSKGIYKESGSEETTLKSYPFSATVPQDFLNDPRPAIVFPHRGAKKNLNPSGATKSMMALAQGLSQQGFRVFILVFQDSESEDFSSGRYWKTQGVWAEYVKAHGLEAVTLDVPYMGKGQPSNIQQANLIKRYTPDWQRLIADLNIGVIHTNDASTHSTVSICCDPIDVRHVWHERGRFNHQVAMPVLERRTDLILTISDFVRGLAPESLRQRVHVIPNPVTVESPADQNAMRNELRKELSVTPDTNLVGMIANKNSRKRWDIFFDAAYQIIEKYQKEGACLPVFIAFGSGAELIEEYKAQFPDDGILDNIVTWGYCENMLQKMAGLDLVVQTAEEEPLGRVVIEAVSLGVPILASDSGGHRELLLKNPELLFASGEVSSAVEAIDTALQKPAYYRQLVAALQPKFSATFDNDHHTRRVVEAYSEAGLLQAIK